MTALKIFVDILSACVELYAFLMFFSICGKIRNVSKLTAIASCIFYICINTLLTNLAQSKVAIFAVNGIIIFFLSFIYDMSFVKRIFSVISVYFVLVIVEVLICLLVAAMAKISIEQLSGNMIVYIISTVLAKATGLAIIRIAKHFIKMRSGKPPMMILAPFVLLPITSFFVLFGLSEFVVESVAHSERVLVVLSALFLMISNIAIFYTFDYILVQKEIERQIQRKARQVGLEKEYYSGIYNKQIISNKTMHDLKNKLFAIKNSLGKDTNQGLLQIDEICQIVDGSALKTITGIDSVDALLHAKNQECAYKGLEIKYKVLLAERVSWDPIDVCVVVGNLLDNAIDALSTMSDVEDRNIYLNIVQNNNFVSITIKNGVSQGFSLERVKKTSKKDKEYHGFGLQNIEEVAKRYNGSMKYGVQNSVFITNVIFEI